MLVVALRIMLERPLADRFERVRLFYRRLVLKLILHASSALTANRLMHELLSDRSVKSAF